LRIEIYLPSFAREPSFPATRILETRDSVHNDARSMPRLSPADTIEALLYGGKAVVD
jgi:hypothetical protein